MSESEWRNAVREVRDHEPPLALLGGSTGTEVIARLIPEAADRLREAGWLLFEISPMIESRVRSLIAKEDRFRNLSVFKDFAGLARVVQVQLRRS